MERIQEDYDDAEYRGYQRYYECFECGCCLSDAAASDYKEEIENDEV